MRRLACLALALLAAAAPPAGAQTLTFAPVACATGGQVPVASPYDEAGFRLAATPRHAFFTTCADFVQYAGSPNLAINNIGAGATLVKIGGGNFAVMSIDLASVYSFTDPIVLTFTADLPGSGGVSQTFTVPAVGGVPPAFATYTFGPEFANVSALYFAPQTGLGSLQPYQFTNLVLGAGIPSTAPEPATLTLVAAGVAALGAAARRRRGTLA